MTVKEYTENLITEVCEKMKFSSIEKTKMMKLSRTSGLYRSYASKKINSKIKPKEKRVYQRPLELKMLSELEKDLIQTAVKIHHLDILDFCKNNQVQENIDCRYQVCYILRYYHGYSLKKTGQVFRKDHSTVINAIHQHCDFMETDKMYAVKYNRLLKELKENNMLPSDLFDENAIEKKEERLS